jgi:23S rRNA pseudouridine1911/1915/1917 synthase
VTYETRTFPVPNGLAGERVDAGLAKLLGLSRSRVAEIVDAGGVTLDGVVAGKSDRLRDNALLEVTWESKAGAND